MKWGRRQLRWFGFATVVGITVLAIGWVGWRTWRWKVEQEVKQWVERYGGTVTYGGDPWMIDHFSDLRTPDFLCDRWGPVMDDIRTVAFYGSPGYTAEEFDRLRSLRSFEGFFVFEGNTFADSHLEVVSRCHSIENVFLVGTSVSEEGFQHLGRMRRLRALTFEGTEIDSAALAHLVDLPHLERLDLNGWRLDSEGLEHLGKMQNLRALQLAGAEIASEDLHLLADLVQLEGLVITHTKWGSEALSYLSSLPNLVTLQVDGLDDSDLVRMEHLTGLQHLEIMESDLSIEGLERLVRALPDLEEIRLPGLPESREEAERVEMFLEWFEEER